jgi:hypothetical protein
LVQERNPKSPLQETGPKPRVIAGASWYGPKTVLTPSTISEIRYARKGMGDVLVMVIWFRGVYTNMD